LRASQRPHHTRFSVHQKRTPRFSPHHSPSHAGHHAGPGTSWGKTCHAGRNAWGADEKGGRGRPATADVPKSGQRRRGVGGSGKKKTLAFPLSLPSPARGRPDHRPHPLAPCLSQIRAPVRAARPARGMRVVAQAAVKQASFFFGGGGGRRLWVACAEARPKTGPAHGMPLDLPPSAAGWGCGSIWLRLCEGGGSVERRVRRARPFRMGSTPLCAHTAPAPALANTAPLTLPGTRAGALPSFRPAPDTSVHPFPHTTPTGHPLQGAAGT